MNGKVYDGAKFVTQIGLPAAGTLYFTIAQIYSLGGGPQVTATVVAVDTFLGIVLGLTSKAYNDSDASKDGFLTQKGTDPDTGMPQLHMALTSLPEDILKQKSITLKVGAPTPEPDHK